MVKNLNKVVIIIQARLGSTRFPNKVMETVGGIPMVKRVWLEAKKVESAFNWCQDVAKVVVAWPERYPDLDENNVLERFRRITKETDADVIIRLTSDCPLLRSKHIWNALYNFHGEYYNNRKDGYDVQIFTKEVLFGNFITDKEHVIKDTPNTGGCSVDTREDLERVRKSC